MRPDTVLTLLEPIGRIPADLCTYLGTISIGLATVAASYSRVTNLPVLDNLPTMQPPPPPPLLLAMLVVALAAEASSAPSYPYATATYTTADDGQAARHGVPSRPRPRQTGGGGNLQTFAGALGGIPAEAVTASGDGERPFAVGGDTFMDLAGAEQRSCDDQRNRCAAVANAGRVGFGVADCEGQAGEFVFFLLLLLPGLRRGGGRRVLFLLVLVICACSSVSLACCYSRCWYGCQYAGGSGHGSRELGSVPCWLAGYIYIYIHACFGMNRGLTRRRRPGQLSAGRP